MANNDVIISDMGKIAPSQHKVNDDFELARLNLMDTIQQTSETIATVMQLADQSQAPRFYEVLNGLFKTNIEANEKLLDIQKKIADLNKQEGNKPAANITNNNLVLTTEEVRKMLMGGQ